MTTLEKTYHWQGREDTEEDQNGLRWHQVMDNIQPTNSCSLLGFECDLGVAANKGRVGAAKGPNVIRNALANLAWHADCDVRDAGNIVAATHLADAQTQYAQQIAKSLGENSFVIGLGGGHEIAWGSYQGLVQHLAANTNKKIGIINFDAHFDLRNPAKQTSSGTPFRQIAEYCQAHHQPFHYACLGVASSSNTAALFNYATHTKTQYLLDIDCEPETAKKCITPMLKAVDELYVTVCLDAFPPHIAPGVSAPSALGISVEFVINMLHWIAKSESVFHYNWGLADIAEMNPTYDIDNRTAKLAARLIYETLGAKFSQ
ncbi:formimidoylglutamase [Paraglaciecola psychrophila]|uniref:Formimidoylglutamase n=1 Tax=Paraglaciecola psychrophila 170 TaxID=1129794 RepID=K7A687_9ALTE|nr:formimidoylglutamase [Paraglaciecola psychrophila]AGH42316.1 formiminoglutamase [Paraglaciecola psychrophila 170]GAC37847.1 formiminoglutamase [Paraglaciecola psychrophila 170]